MLGGDGFKTERLNCDKGRHSDHSYQPERVRQNFRLALQCKANPNHKGENKAGRKRTAGNPTGVERDCRIQLWNEERQAQRQEIAGDEIVQDTKIVNGANRGKGDRHADAYGERDQHRTLADGTARYCLDLFIEDVDGRFCQNDGKTEHETRDNEQGIVAAFSELIAHFIADGHKADGDGKQENYQTEEGVKNTDDNLFQTFFRQFHKEMLQDKEEDNDRQQCNRHFLPRVQKGSEKIAAQMRFNGIIGQGILHFAARKNAQNHYGEDRPDRAQRDKTEAIFTVTLVTERRRDTHAERHNKGYGDRPRRHAARIEREGQKALVAADNYEGYEGE